MDNPTLDERCAELKARMLAAKHKKPLPPAPVPNPAGPAPARTVRQSGPESAQTVIQPPIEIRNPHPLVKAALSGMREVSEDYGSMQFRWRGHLDARVNKAFARRALKIFDTLIKRVEALGLRVEIGVTDRGPYSRPRETTFVTDAAWEKSTEMKQGAIQPGSPADGFRRWAAFVIDQVGPLL
jgi:hypothetical protein